MNKHLLVLSTLLCALVVYNVSADIIGGALDLARGAVDTAANVAEGAIDVVDRGTYPVREYPYDYPYDFDEDEVGEHTVVTKTVEPHKTIVEEKTVKTYETD